MIAFQLFLAPFDKLGVAVFHSPCECIDKLRFVFKL